MPVILQVPPVFRRFVYPWITPAHAGKTSTPALTGFPLRDHPRACGENTSMAMTQASTTGSPPRMRGKLLRDSHKQLSGGITPAHAGKTEACHSNRRVYQDHPRACGENTERLKIVTMLSGSPPRMRGKLLRDSHKQLSGGITPAHAGKTEACHSNRRVYQDHPRACGENWQAVLLSRSVLGSPPRMRGKLLSSFFEQT